jgi:fructokinase
MRFGIDLGGTKIEIMALENGGREILRERVATPRADYDATVRAIAGLVQATEAKLAVTGSVGLCIPGAISRKTGLVKNANSTNLIGHPLDRDLAAALARPVRVENDANCFALSEASDGAGIGARVVFGVITGTGVGGGVVVDGQVLTGPHAVAGEWGHNGLPRPTLAEVQQAPACYCGKKGCIETWCSGPALARLYEAHTGGAKALPDIVAAAARGEQASVTALENFYDRLARALSEVVNILDPDIIVMGGGLSNIEALYTELPPRVEHYAFTTEGPTRIVRNKHGDSSGVRGAAWLWSEQEAAAS